MIEYPELYEEATKIQSTLECVCPSDPSEMYARLAELNVLLARTSEMYAEARHLLNLRRQEVFVESMEVIKDLSATLANKYIDAQVADEMKLADWVERLNKTIVHQSDNMRSMFSYAKEEMKLTRNGY